MTCAFVAEPCAWRYGCLGFVASKRRGTLQGGFERPSPKRRGAARLGGVPARRVLRPEGREYHRCDATFVTSRVPGWRQRSPGQVRDGQLSVRSTQAREIAETHLAAYAFLYSSTSMIWCLQQNRRGLGCAASTAPSCRWKPYAQPSTHDNMSVYANDRLLASRTISPSWAHGKRCCAVATGRRVFLPRFLRACACFATLVAIRRTNLTSQAQTIGLMRSALREYGLSA
jgi:hypothetical protein